MSNLYLLISSIPPEPVIHFHPNFLGLLWDAEVAFEDDMALVLVYKY